MATVNHELVRRVPASLLAQSPPTGVPIGVSQFAASGIGSQLNCTCIAHHKGAQIKFDALNIGWGTQYELARGVSNGTWTWPDVIAHVSRLTGPNSIAAPKVQTIIRPSSPTQNPISRSADFLLWKELDREQAAIVEDRGRGLGLMGEWMGVTDWYGGRIQQVARLAQVDPGNTLKIVLEKMESRRSHRFARFYGSRRFLQVHVPQTMLWDQEIFGNIQVFFQQKFVICGRVYVPFHAKNGNVYMVEIDENHERETRNRCGDHLRLSFSDFIQFHNPLEENFNQGMGKYTTRFALGLSNTAPALEFALEHIYFVDDVVASNWPRAWRSPPPDKLMTDGCGFMNHSAMSIIFKKFGYESIPAGVQGRIDGSKGFWILHPTNTSDFPEIWIRSSQKKINNRLFGRAHRIFDLLAPARPSPSYRLSPQTITNLFFNGVPQERLVQLMEQTLEDKVKPLLDWDSPNAMISLADVISKAGNISGTRAQRNVPSQNRILGLKGHDWGTSESLPDDNEPDATAVAAATARSFYSGAPASLHESALEMLQAGFHPAKNKILNSKIKNMVEMIIGNTIANCDIPIEESVYSFMVPDPLGILEEGQISYRFSKPRKDPKTDLLIDCIEGKVVLGRYPIRLPSDMQKVTAVDRPELHKWRDVVVISTKGKRSIANLLAGGDMDGDEVVAIWDPAIVDPFLDENPLTAMPEDLMSSDFTPGDTTTVEDFCNKALSWHSRRKNREFLTQLLTDLADSGKGFYAKMHDAAVVEFGYDDERTIRLAYIFAILLDSSKTGVRLRPGVRGRDARLKNEAKRLRSRPPVPNILQMLKDAGNRKKDQIMARYKETVDKSDPDLSKPYEDVLRYARRYTDNYGVTDLEEELGQIVAHVESIRYDWVMWFAACRMKKEVTKPAGNGLPEGCAKRYVKPIDGLCLIVGAEQDRIKASYAYTLSERMAFGVAFRDLCSIKAMASSTGLAPMTRTFDEAKTFSSSFLRTLRGRGDDAEPEAGDTTQVLVPSGRIHLFERN